MCYSTAVFFFFKQKTAYEMRISDWSSDVCSSDLLMVVDAVPFIGTIFVPGATVEMMRPQAEAMAAAMRAQYGKPKPAGPVADPGAADRKSTRLNYSH